MINPSANNVFVFGDFNTHHKDWLTYSGGTDRSGELCYNFPTSNDLTQMVNFPAGTLTLQACSFGFFLFLDTIICSTMAFPQLGNSDRVVVSVPIDFTINEYTGLLAFHLLFLLNPRLIVEMYYFGRCSSELAQLVLLPFSQGRLTCYSDRLHDFSVTISRCFKDVYVSNFFSRTARLWNFLPVESFLLTNDLSGFKSRINRHFLTVSSS